MPEKIVVPLDGTEYAEQVVPFVQEMAKAGQLDVTLLTIIDPAELDVTETAGEGIPDSRDRGGINRSGMDLEGEGSGGLTGMVWMAPIGSPQDLSEEEAQALDEATQRANRYLSSLEQQLEDAGVNTDTRLGFGNPDTEIVEEAIRTGATMIAMSARSTTFWERGVLGSTTDRVVSGSPMPVIVFKPMEGLADAISVKPETVLIALDGSEASESSLKPAADLARAVGAKMALIHVLKRDRGRRRERAQSYLDGLKARLGGDVAVRVVEGDVDEEIIAYADELGKPVIVMTEHGGISIGRWLRGSSADKVVRNAGYPVMVVAARE